MHLPSHRRAPHPHTVLLMLPLILPLILPLMLMLILVLILTVSKLRCAPHPYIVLFMLLLRIAPCEDGEHARDFQ
jgi:hypothetical protein